MATLRISVMSIIAMVVMVINESCHQNIPRSAFRSISTLPFFQYLSIFDTISATTNLAQMYVISTVCMFVSLCVCLLV